MKKSSLFIGGLMQGNHTTFVMYFNQQYYSIRLYNLNIYQEIQHQLALQ